MNYERLKAKICMGRARSRILFGLPCSKELLFSCTDFHDWVHRDMHWIRFVDEMKLTLLPYHFRRIKLWNFSVCLRKAFLSKCVQKPENINNVLQVWPGVLTSLCNIDLGAHHVLNNKRRRRQQTDYERAISRVLYESKSRVVSRQPSPTLP